MQFSSRTQCSSRIQPSSETQTTSNTQPSSGVHLSSRTESDSKTRSQTSPRIQLSSRKGPCPQTPGLDPRTQPDPTPYARPQHLGPPPRAPTPDPSQISCAQPQPHDLARGTLPNPSPGQSPSTSPLAPHPQSPFIPQKPALSPKPQLGPQKSTLPTKSIIPSFAPRVALLRSQPLEPSFEGPAPSSMLRESGLPPRESELLPHHGGQ